MRPRRQSVIIGIAIGAIVVATCGAIASRRMTDRAPQYAQVIAVSPIVRRVRMPHEVCKSEEVKHVRPAQPQESAPPGESAPPEEAAQHKEAARRMRSTQRERSARSEDTYTTIEEHCVTAYETKEERQGYEVRYRLNGAEGSLRMDHVPGARVPVRD